MRRLLPHLSCLFFWALAATGTIQAANEDDPSISAERDAIVKRIDDLIEQRWGEAGTTPAEQSTDSEFHRRVYLDLIGVVPRVAEVRRFLEDTSPDKRIKLVETLLESPGHATHLANTWRSLMLPGGLEIEQFQSIAGVQNWLRAQFVDNMRYDRIVSDFLVATGGGDSGPALYYTSLELKPEKLAASTARIFLGLQIECAECHDHPFDHWKQRDFWGYAAYFAQLRPMEQTQPVMQNVSLVDLDRGEVKLPGTDEIITPRFPGPQDALQENSGVRRVQLAIWIASRDNPYLARATVNRVWAQLFGRGLVEPVDDLSQHNPPSHPELFDELSQYFVRSGYDLRELYRVLARTRAYGLSSRMSQAATPPELFASMAIKTLTAEQLYDCLARISGRSYSSMAPFGNAAGRLFDQRRIAFVGKMEAKGRSAIEYHAGVPQALTLINGMDVDQLTAGESSLIKALESDLFTDDQRVDTLCLATLSRYPSESERASFVDYLKGAADTRPKALGDILWALVNAAEFQLNH